MIKNEMNQIILEGNVETINNELKQLMRQVYLYNIQKYGKKMARSLLMAYTFAILDQNDERIVYD